MRCKSKRVLSADKWEIWLARVRLSDDDERNAKAICCVGVNKPHDEIGSDGIPPEEHSTTATSTKIAALSSSEAIIVTIWLR